MDALIESLIILWNDSVLIINEKLTEIQNFFEGLTFRFEFENMPKDVRKLIHEFANAHNFYHWTISVEKNVLFLSNADKNNHVKYNKSKAYQERVDDKLQKLPTPFKTK